MSFLIAFLCVFGIVGLVYQYLLRKLTHHRPKNFPKKEAITPINDKITVTCIGDSITHGNVSTNYVTMLEKQLGRKYFFYNAGVNSDLTYAVLQRLDDVIATQPDFVTLLIGTNDVNATVSSGALKRYRQFKKIEPSEMPTFDTFQQNYSKIITRLKLKTTAKIAVMSLPVMGENLENEANQKADRYSNFIKQIAQDEDLDYLPLREKMKVYLQQNPKKLKYEYKDTMKLMYFSIIRHELWGQDWDKICTAHGMDLTQDNLHFNTRGAAMIASLVQKWLDSE